METWQHMFQSHGMVVFPAVVRAGGKRRPSLRMADALYFSNLTASRRRLACLALASGAVTHSLTRAGSEAYNAVNGHRMTRP